MPGTVVAGTRAASPRRIDGALGDAPQLGHDVRDEPHPAVGGGYADHRGLGDAFELCERAFGLHRADHRASDLHAVVRSSDVNEHAVVQPSDEITRGEGTPPVGQVDEAFRGEDRIVPVPEGEAAPDHDQPARLAVADVDAVVVDDAGVQPRFDLADGHDAVDRVVVVGDDPTGDPVRFGTRQPVAKHGVRARSAHVRGACRVRRVLRRRM